MKPKYNILNTPSCRDLSWSIINSIGGSTNEWAVYSHSWNKFSHWLQDSAYLANSRDGIKANTSVCDYQDKIALSCWPCLQYHILSPREHNFVIIVNFSAISKLCHIFVQDIFFTFIILKYLWFVSYRNKFYAGSLTQPCIFFVLIHINIIMSKCKLILRIQVDNTATILSLLFCWVTGHIRACRRGLAHTRIKLRQPQ